MTISTPRTTRRDGDPKAKGWRTRWTNSLSPFPCRSMSTLTLRQAAALLKIHPVTLQEKARAGVIPGAKIGRAWVFVEIDLLEYIRAQYTRRAFQGDRKELECHSSNARTHPI